jgi:hypothetical protein
VFGLDQRREKDLREWVSRRWFEIVGSGDMKHFRAGTRVESLKSVDGVLGYLCKYISSDKDQTRPGNFTGRYWGNFNKVALPFSETETIDFESYRESVVVARWIRKRIEKNVNESRWHNLLKDGTQPFVAVEGYSRLLIERMVQSPQKQVRIVRRLKHITPADWKRKLPQDHVSEGLECWGALGSGHAFKFPKRYKTQLSQNVRMITDAARFRDDFLRARALGIFESPQRQLGRASAKLNTVPKTSEGDGSRGGPGNKSRGSVYRPVLAGWGGCFCFRVP